MAPRYSRWSQTVVQKMMENFQGCIFLLFLIFFFFFDSRLIHNRTECFYFSIIKNILYIFVDIIFILFGSSFTRIEKANIFSPDFGIRFRIFLDDSGQVNGNLLFFSRGTKNFTFKRSSLFRGHPKYVSSVIASHLLN